MDQDYNDRITVGSSSHPDEVNPLQADDRRLSLLALVPLVGVASVESILTDMYTTLRYNRAITTTSGRRTLPDGRVVRFLNGYGVAAGSPQGNDVLVTVDSALAQPSGTVVAPITQVWQGGVGNTPTPGKNHSGIGDSVVAALVAFDLLAADRAAGGMRP